MSTAFLTRALRVRHVLQSEPGLSGNQFRQHTSHLSTGAAVLPHVFFTQSDSIQEKDETPHLRRESFLEDRSKEYGYGVRNWKAQAKLHGKGKAALKRANEEASNLLLGLIAKGEMIRAEAAKAEYEKGGVEILRQKAFADAAAKALDIVSPHDRMRQFITWWSLTPVEECVDKFRSLDRRLLDHPFDLLAHAFFCLHSVRQGLITEVGSSHVLRHVFRFGVANATAALLFRIEEEVMRQRPEDKEVQMSFRMLAIRMHLLASRRQYAAKLYYEAPVDLDIDEGTKDAILNDGIGERHNASINYHPSPTRRYTPRGESLDDVDLVSELRSLRRLVSDTKQPPAFEPFLADFLYAYSKLRKNGKAPQLLRKSVFSRRSSTVRMRWIGGELTLYSATSKPIATLKTYLHYCLADNVLAAEARRVLEETLKLPINKRRALDTHFANTLPRTGWRLWPNALLTSAAWKAVLLLSKRDDLERLYSLLISIVERASSEEQHRYEELHGEQGDNVLGIHDVYYGKLARAATSPLVFPGPSVFHHFVVALSTRIAPRRGSAVMADMHRLGLKPKKRTWGALAGAYARSGDMKRLTSILDHIDSFDNGTSDSMTHAPAKKRLVPRLAIASTLMVYNSVLRGLTECGMYPETYIIQERMRERGLFADDIDKRTKAILHLRSRYEKGKFAPYYKKALLRRRRVKVDGRYLRIDEKRVDWLNEELD